MKLEGKRTYTALGLAAASLAASVAARHGYSLGELQPLVADGFTALFLALAAVGRKKARVTVVDNR